MNDRSINGPLGIHVGDDYVRVLTTPESATEDYIADIYGEDAAGFGHLFAAAPALKASLEVFVDAFDTIRKRGYAIEGFGMSVSEAMDGAEAALAASHPPVPDTETCEHCEGTGKLMPDCTECSGHGWIDDPSDGGTMTCPLCDDEECPDCEGKGEVDVSFR